MTTLVDWIWQDWTLGTLSKTVILQLAVLTLVWFLRRSSAALRHLVLTVGVGAVLALPLLSLAVPAWHLGLIPAPIGSVDAGSGGSVLGVGSQAKVSGDSRVDESRPARTGERPFRLAPASSVGNPALAGWLGVCWIIGSLSVLTWLLAGSFLAAWIGRKASAVSDPELIDRVEAIGARLGVKRPVAVLLSGRISVPVVSGIFPPKLILPKGISSWSRERLESILQHELAHIRRNDVITQALAYLSCCLYWFNPLAWIMERRLMIERERACDNSVLGENVKASDYAEHLLRVSEELAQTRQSIWALAMAEGTDFKDRILSILDPNARRDVPRPVTAFLVILLGALLVVPLAAFTPWERSVEEGAEPIGKAVPVSQVEQAREPRGTSEAPSKPLQRILLQDGDPKTREHAAGALGMARDLKAVPALIDALSDPEPKVREHVATALGQIGDRAAVPALIERLSDKDARVREHVAAALGQLRDDRAVEPLIDTYRGESDNRVRRHILSALGSIGDSRAFPVLVEALSDPDSQIRNEAAEALGLLGDRRAVDPLQEALEDSSESVREKARRAINQLFEQ